MSVIIATGRLGKDAELRTTQGGTKVAEFSIADEVGYGQNKKTQWLKCAMFGERAEKVAPYLTKGSLIEIHGTPQAEGWSKNNEVRAQIKVSVSEVKLHGGGKRDDGEVNEREPTRGSAPAKNDLDDGIPFAPEWR